VEYDEEAAKIWKTYSEIQTIQDWKQRRKKYLEIKKRFPDHVISVPEKYRNLVGWNKERGFGYISRLEIMQGNLYDLNQGFIRERDQFSVLII